LGDDIDIESPDSRPKSKPLLNRDVLLRQFGTFHTVATEVAKRLPAEWRVIDSDENLVDTHRTEKFWKEMEVGETCSSEISEFIHLAKLVLVMVPGSVEDERVFSTWGYIHDGVRNRLKSNHLNLCMRMYLQNWWSVEDFPYAEALEFWHKNSGTRGRYGRPTAI